MDLSEELFKRAAACSCLTQEIQILLKNVISLSCNCNENGNYVSLPLAKCRTGFMRTAKNCLGTPLGGLRYHHCLIWKSLNARNRYNKSIQCSLKLLSPKPIAPVPPVVYSELNEYHLILSGLFSNFKSPTLINKLLHSLVYYVGGFKIRK